MLPRHEVAREAWARQKVTWNPADWRNVVWSDEKKFNLDGPDGFAYYWHDLRTERRIFSKRQQDGNSIMAWGAFFGSNKCELVVLSGTTESRHLYEYFGDLFATFRGARTGSKLDFYAGRRCLPPRKSCLPMI